MALRDEVVGVLDRYDGEVGAAAVTSTLIDVLAAYVVSEGVRDEDVVRRVLTQVRASREASGLFSVAR